MDNDVLWLDKKEELIKNINEAIEKTTNEKHKEIFKTMLELVNNVKIIAKK